MSVGKKKNCMYVCRERDALQNFHHSSPLDIHRELIIRHSEL